MQTILTLSIHLLNRVLNLSLVWQAWVASVDEITSDEDLLVVIRAVFASIFYPNVNLETHCSTLGHLDTIGQGREA